MELKKRQPVRETGSIAKNAKEAKFAKECLSYFASFASFAILPSPSNLIYAGIGSHWLPLLWGNHVLNVAPIH